MFNSLNRESLVSDYPLVCPAQQHEQGTTILKSKMAGHTHGFVLVNWTLALICVYFIVLLITQFVNLPWVTHKRNIFRKSDGDSMCLGLNF